jgi:N-acetylneuraminic acid mutarotase
MRHVVRPHGKRLWRRLGALIVLAGVVLVSLSAVGVDLPGPPVKQWLGLADEVSVVCTPTAETVLVPSGPAPQAGAWRPERELPSPEHPELDAAEVNGIVYLVGGLARAGDFEFKSVDTVLGFDPESGDYEELPALPVRLDHELVVGYEGSLYVVGGYRDFEPVAELWRLDLASGEWASLAPMRQARGGLAGAVIDGRLYAVGGAQANTGDPSIAAHATLEIYDFATDEWSFGPDMPTPRHHFAAAAAGGKLYAVGGRHRGDFTSDAFEEFDPLAGVWSSLEPIPVGVGSADAATVDGRIVVIGGGNDDFRSGWVTPAVWAYDIAADAWTRLPDLEVARHGHAAAVAAGRIYAFGGSPCPGYGVLRSVESVEAPA